MPFKAFPKSPSSKFVCILETHLHTALKCIQMLELLLTLLKGVLNSARAYRISNFGLALKSHTFTLAPWKKGLHLETLPHLNRGQRPYSPLSWWPFKQNQSTACSRALSMKHSITELTSFNTKDTKTQAEEHPLLPVISTKQ